MRPQTGILLAILATASGCGWGPFDNKHYMDGGKLIRTAQPTEGDLRRAMEDDGIKTIVNLRGHNAGKSWYDMEYAFAQEHGLDHYSVRLSKGRLPTEEQLGDLLEIFETAERPMLMHCQSGSDRTGFGAVVYRLVVMEHPLDEALDSFSIRYGHLPGTPLDHLFEIYREEANGRRFDVWYEEDYDLERLNAKLVARGVKPFVKIADEP
jgi:protein tyrosine phosphatase (PTP) superfamily phosphohydrolase (DUF442 family)